MDRLVSVLGQVCKSHAVVGEDSVNPVGKSVHHAAQEVCAVHLAHVVPEFNVSKLGNPVNGQNILSLPSARRGSAMSM